MNIKSVIPGIKAVACLRHFRKSGQEVEAARAAGDFVTERKIINEATTIWSRNLLQSWGCSLRIKGYDNIPDDGPVAIVMNHQSYCDIVCACAVIDKFQFGFIAKSELGKMPFYGKWMMMIRSVLLERNNPRAALKSMNEATELLKKGFSLVIFPEGTRSKAHRIGEFKKGSLKFAVRAGVKLLPIVIDGTAEMYEIPGYIRGWELKASVLSPIETDGMSKDEESVLHEKLCEMMKSEFSDMITGIDDAEYEEVL